MKTFDEHIERYFEGLTTPEEERELREFLVCPEGQGPEYDDVRAVMVFFATGKSLHCREEHTGRIAPARSLFARIAAVAAAAALLAGVGVGLHRDGQIAEMENTLAELLDDNSRPDLAEGLGEIFK